MIKIPFKTSNNVVRYLSDEETHAFKQNVWDLYCTEVRLTPANERGEVTLRGAVQRCIAFFDLVHGKGAAQAAFNYE
jgi:hypothetical protein